MSTGGLRAGEPGWVEFDVPAGPTSAPSARPPAQPSATPADALAGGRGAAWLVLQPDASVVAFAPKCTHRLCLYDWDGASREFRCRCHPGLFAIDGKVLGGPPPRPLERLETRPAGPRVVQIGWVEQT